jgi:hypothetical protein
MGDFSAGKTLALNEVAEEVNPVHLHLNTALTEYLLVLSWSSACRCSAGRTAKPSMPSSRPSAWRRRYPPGSWKPALITQRPAIGGIRYERLGPQANLQLGGADGGRIA